SRGLGDVYKRQVYAIGLLLVGFLRRARSLRFAALGLFGLSALKLVFVDLARVEDIYRVFSFLGLGVFMIAGAYLYHRLEKYLAAGDAAASGGAKSASEGGSSA
ncbi:MAG: DUF2339 domain-containing protein, partial [Planctomycetota bacterium]|nr:DUF2339 domain-containing protein [Planctomycetota bacterium]